MLPSFDPAMLGLSLRFHQVLSGFTESSRGYLDTVACR